jgi:hypothetical protein
MQISWIMVQLSASSACVIAINFKLVTWLWHDSCGILDAAVPFISQQSPRDIYRTHIPLLTSVIRLIWAAGMPIMKL